MARNEKAPETIKIRPFSEVEAARVTRAYKTLSLKKPEFWTHVILHGCEEVLKEVRK